MPRLKKRSVNFEDLQLLLKGYGLNGNNLAPILGQSHVTAKKKIDNPELFTLKDLNAINRRVGVSWDEIRGVIIR